MKKISTTLLLVLAAVQLFAQTATAPDSLYASDKIYVVVICAGIILLGLIIFLFSIDRRLKKIEKKSSGKN